MSRRIRRPGPFRVCPGALLSTALLLLALAACSPTEQGDGGVTPAGNDAAQAPAGADRQRPNILYIQADDIGYGDIGVFGGEIPTPHLDALASDGMLLTAFYTHMTCSPTRAMLMSGMSSHLSGLGVMTGPTRPEHQGRPEYAGYLNFQVASLADLMSDAGYDTYLSGKWHLGDTPGESSPRARGFQRVFASVDGAAHLGPWDWRGPTMADYYDGDELVHVDDDFYSTRVYTERLIEFIEADREGGRPFFAWLAYTAPHWPLQAPEESIARFRGWYDDGYEALYARRFARQKEIGLVDPDAEPIADERFSPRWDSLSDEEQAFKARRMEIYAAMVSDMDIYIGQLVDYLREIGELENTFIVFSSDNGPEPMRRDLEPPIEQHVGGAYDHSLDNLGSATSYVMYGPNWASASATPWHRHKFTAFEGGVRVPAFVHYPPMVEAGTRNDGFSTVMDLMPTFLELAGHEHPGTHYRGQEVLPMQGSSMLPLLRNETGNIRGDGDVVGWELFGQRGVRDGDWKLVWDHAEGEDQRRWRLFNIVDDPFEQNDLSASRAERFEEMLALWDRFEVENRVIY